jgi:hypothetical protein
MSRSFSDRFCLVALIGLPRVTYLMKKGVIRASQKRRRKRKKKTSKRSLAQKHLKLR